MIQYEYETLYGGQLVKGQADHVKVRYSQDSVEVLIMDVTGWPLDSVKIVGPLTIPSSHHHETLSFMCDKFSINGKDLSHG